MAKRSSEFVGTDDAGRLFNYPGRRSGASIIPAVHAKALGFGPSFVFLLPPHPSQDSRHAPPLFLLPSSESWKASQTQRAAAMATPDAEQPAPTEPARWRDLDMLLSRPGNLVAASFDPSPTVSGPGPPPPIHPLFSRVLLVGG